MTTDLTFFTNEPDATLEDRFVQTLRAVKYFDVLVGYFRSSGFNRLADSLSNVEKIRILVGLNIDQRSFQIIDSVNQPSFEFQSHEKTRNAAMKDVLAEVEASEDDYTTEIGIRKFIEFLSTDCIEKELDLKNDNNGKKLEFRAHPSGNIHAKVYISRYREEQVSYGSVITGSSNFSFAKNIIACAAIADTLNISWELFRDRISTFQPPPGRCEIKKSNNMTFIDDTYNANLESTVAAIDYLTGFSGNGRRILIFGDMFELGNESKNQHIKVGQKCAESDLDLVFTVGNETVATHESIFSGPGHMHFSTKEDLIKELRTEIMDGDKILVKGSRGMAMETIIETLMK